MYNITREQASSLLNISTRSIDRYIRNGKLRSKKDGKIVYIHQDDIDNFLSPTSKQEIIINTPISQEISTIKQDIDGEIYKIYEDLKNEIKEKDEEINELNMKIGKMEEVVKNSISMIEFKKSQFLLEESKNSVVIDLENTKKELEEKTVEIRNEKKLNYILLSALILFIIILMIIWFVKI